MARVSLEQRRVVWVTTGVKNGRLWDSLVHELRQPW